MGIHADHVDSSGAGTVNGMPLREDTTLTAQYERSAALAARAAELMPGGVTSINHLLPRGVAYIDRAEGAHLWDVDGNRYVDFWNSHSALIAGHNHPVVREAIVRQLARGTNYGLAAPVQVDLAERLQSRFPGLERLLLTDSATRSVGYAVRLARAATGRDRVAKVHGAYHGTADTLYFGLQPGYGYGEEPGRMVTRPGVPASAADDVVLLQWNEFELTELSLEANEDRLAAVIVEPVLGDGVLTPAPGYLELLRTWSNDAGAVLIFDETVTCGIGEGGAQEHYGVRPDLTCLGKTIGGGLPIGAIGGVADLMALADPTAGIPPVPVAMTYPGHPLSCAAGVAQLDLLDVREHARLAELAQGIASGIAHIGAVHSVPLHATSIGHLFFFHWGRPPVRTFREHFGCDRDALAYLSARLLDGGCYMGWHGRGCVTLAHNEDHIEMLLACVEAAVADWVRGVAAPRAVHDGPGPGGVDP